MNKDELFPSDGLIPVLEKLGNTLKVVRYIQQDQTQLNKHKQLKQNSLDQRKQKNNLLSD